MLNLDEADFQNVSWPFVTKCTLTDSQNEHTVINTSSSINKQFQSEAWTINHDIQLT